MLSGLSEDPADLSDAEPDVDDQTAREGVPEIVDTKPQSPVGVQAGAIGCAAEAAPLDVAEAERPR